MTRPRSWTVDQLRRVLAEGECDTAMDVVVALGLGPWKGNIETVRRVAAENGLRLPSGWSRDRKRPTPSGVDGGREGG